MIRVAIWGAGAIAHTHVDAFSYWKEQCDIVCIVNRTVERAERLVQAKGLSARVYGTMDEAIAREEIDAVSIVLPPMMHAEAVEYAASKGLHVLVEKPMANSLEECDRMIRACEQANVLLSVVCQMRFCNEIRKIKQMISEERFGKLLYVHAASCWWRGQQYHDLYWRGTWEKEGGGVLMIQAIHHLDLVLYLAGAPESIHAVMDNVGHFNSECEDVASLSLRYPGKFAQFDASMVSHGEDTRLDFYTEKVRLSYPWSVKASKAMDNGFPLHDKECVKEAEDVFSAIPATEDEYHTAQAGNFLKAIEGKEPLIADGHEGRRVIEVITAAYKSACEGREVSLPLFMEDPFYTNEGKTKLLPHFHEKRKSVESMGDGPIVLAEEVP